MAKILVGIPTYDNRLDARQALFLYAARRENLTVDVKSRQLSLLAWGFNMLWADALNNKTYDYFLLLHADIVPHAPVGWLSKLIAEAENARADLLGAVIPIKNKTGLTSTALQAADHEPRRVTMREALTLPQTFNAEDVARVFGWQERAGLQLLANTGCMLMDLRKKRAAWEQMYFRIQDAMTRVDGKFVPTCIPEDWDFSMQAARLGLRVAVTRAVSIIHSGHADYENQSAWGEIEHETD